MSISNLLQPNNFTLYSKKNITEAAEIGDVTIINDGVTTGTYSTAQLANALSGGGGGGGNISGTLVSGYIPLASGTNTITSSDMTENLSYVTVNNKNLSVKGTDSSTKFNISDSIGNDILNVNTSTGFINTKNNVLDNGSGGVYIAENAQILGRLTLTSTDYSDKMSVLDNSLSVVFNVDTISSNVSTKNCTINGDATIQGSDSTTKLNVVDNSTNPVVSIDTTNKILTIADGTAPKIRFWNDGSNSAFGLGFNVAKNLITQDNPFVGSFAWAAWTGDGGSPPNFSVQLTNGIVGPPAAYLYFHPTVVWPARNNIALGQNNLLYSWSNIYSQTPVVVVSDANAKNSITDTNLGLTFINKLKPRSYKINNGTSDRRHHGLIAQEVKSTMDELNISTSDFAGYIFTPSHTIKTDDNVETTLEDAYALRYEEFISPMIKSIQELTNLVNMQAVQIANLQTQVNSLLNG